ncbi:adenylyl-sulfate kinase [Nostocoides australiense]|nr:adenylyl-sulfate kinase [Propionibacteriaceae bacterium]
MAPRAGARGSVAAEVAHHGDVAICRPIAPREKAHQEVGELVRRRGGRFALVHVATPLEECGRRDAKGLYPGELAGIGPRLTHRGRLGHLTRADSIRADGVGACEYAESHR